jgi:ABC-2 type transport system ATP-binding protein
VPEGSLFALLGPNGAGKTTAIRMLMNIVRPSGGEATVLGVDTRGSACQSSVRSVTCPRIRNSRRG